MAKLLTGTEAADAIGVRALLGKGAAARVEARGGDDRLRGGALDDTLLGEAGADLLFGGPGGADRLDGGEGNDRFRAAPGDGGVDSIRGGDGKDRLLLRLDAGQAADPALLAEIARVAALVEAGADPGRSEILGLDIAGIERLVAREAARRPPVLLAEVAAGEGGVRVLAESGGAFLAPVAAAGDVNADGVEDLLLGATGTGSAYVVFGRDWATSDVIDLARVAAGVGGFAIRGEAAGDNAGRVAGAGDVNGDGLADLLVGAPSFDGGVFNGRGAAYVVFGKASGEEVDLAQVALGMGGFRITGEARGDGFGRSVAAAGDVNGDGLADLLIGADGNDAGARDAGAAYVVFGKADGLEVALGAAPPGVIRLLGSSVNEAVGAALAGVGDVNGDDLADLLVGAPAHDGPGGGTNTGAAFLVFGQAAGDTIALDAAVAAGRAVRLLGQAAFDFVGFDVAAAGDLNGDGIGDLLIGAPGLDAAGDIASGAVYALFGRDWTGVRTLPLAEIAAGVGGFQILGARAFDNLGQSLAPAGDVNRDGLADVLIGTPNAGPGGEVYLVFGKADGATLDLVRVGRGREEGVVILAEAPGDGAGAEVAGPGDLTGDGLPELLIGAVFNDARGDASGAAYLLFGREDWLA